MIRILFAFLCFLPNLYSQGNIIVENRSIHTRNVIQTATVPFNEGEFFLSDGLTIANEPCQIERWLAPYPDGSEKCVKVFYPARLTANNLRITHPVNVEQRAIPPFAPNPQIINSFRNLWLIFFAGPKDTHWCPVFGPGIFPKEIIRSGSRVQTLRFFNRVPDTQVWVEVDVSIYTDVPYSLLHLRWGIDDPRSGEYSYNRTNFTDQQTEIGFLLVGDDKARLQPLAPQTCVRSLEKTEGAWKWVWDRRTRNLSGVILNDQLPWGCALHAQAVISVGDNSWLDAPFYHDGISDQWKNKPSAYEAWGSIPRLPKIHEHWQGFTFDQIRNAVERECSDMLLINGSRYCEENYAWNHQPALRIEELWHQADGQTGGSHGYWMKNPCITSVLYGVPGESHYVRRAMYICPWPYTGYRELDGSMFSCLNHPMTSSNRGQPAGVHDRHGKPPPPPFSEHPLLLEPRSSGRLWGADGAHFETGWPHMHSTIFGDDGTRRIAESLCYGPVHLGNWNMDPARYGSTGEQRNWARGVTQWARSLYLFDDSALVDYCADVFLNFRVKPEYDNTSQLFPNRVIHSCYFLRPRREGDQRVNLANYMFFKPWEICHAVGEHAIACLASYRRSELNWFRVHAFQNTSDVFRYGSPRVVDEDSGQILSTYFRQGGIYEPAQAAAIADGATRHLTTDEINDNNWTRCPGTGECGDPPTNDGYLRLGVPGAGTGSFTAGLADLVLDGPLCHSIIARYIDPVLSRTPERPNDGSHLTWLHKLFRWRVGIADDLILGQANTYGPTGNIRSMAYSNLYLDMVWCLDNSGLFLKNILTGQGIFSAPMATTDIEAITTFIVGGTSFLAYVTATELKILSEQGLHLALTSNIAAIGKPSALCWFYPLGGFLVAANDTLWLIKPWGDPERIMKSKIIIDQFNINHISCTVDGKIMAISSEGGATGLYLWNSSREMWGDARLYTQMHFPVWNLFGRNDNRLRLIFTNTLNFITRQI